jgi:hypothetical protein
MLSLRAGWGAVIFRRDHGQLIDAIKRKLLPLGDDVTFIPGHGPLSTLGYERLHNPFLQDEMPVW